LPKLRILPGKDICRILAKHDFTKVRRHGSHIVIRNRPRKSIVELEAELLEYLNENLNRNEIENKKFFIFVFKKNPFKRGKL
jgi:predicted RNA binding protein YcfA (HicA-like mRNA interferase family)